MVDDAGFFEKPSYTNNPILSMIPWISGFVMPVLPFYLLFHQNWFATFIINIPIVYYLGPVLTKWILVRFASGKGAEIDMFNSFFYGIVTLLIGFFIW
jgi:hypothetical protein